MSNKQLLELKNKQKQLNASTIDSLKTGLQQKYDQVFIIADISYDDDDDDDDDDDG